MASAHTFDFVLGQGVIFTLSAKAKRDRTQTFGSWEVELRKGVGFLCVHRAVLNSSTPMSEVVESAHEAAQQMLDIIAVEERVALLVIEPHDNVAWRTGQHGLKVELTSSITFSAEPAEFKVIARNAQGESVPDTPYVPPQHHIAYRYFRYSQAAHNVFDAYRNMFLAFESLLDTVTPKQGNEGETDWLRRALADAVRLKGLNLDAFTRRAGNDQIEDFVDAHYSAVRCAIFHAKSSIGRALRPGSLSDQDTSLRQLLAVQALVEHLLKSEFSVRLPNSGFYHSGFGILLSQLARVAALLVSVGACPTVEQLLAEERNLDEGTAVPVTFAGLNEANTDEWLFVSKINPDSLSFTRIRSLRLIARPNDHILLGPIARKMNGTLTSTDLDLQNVSNFVVHVRCILRNVQSEKRGFIH